MATRRSSNTTGEAISAGSEMHPAEDSAIEARSQSRTRLIEHYLPLVAMSEEGMSERYGHGRTPHTIFTWWARRPFSAVRAIVAASLLEAERSTEGNRWAIESYCVSPNSVSVQQKVKRLLRAEEQRVLDMFAGGATIPLEVATIGAQAHSVENNELAHFIGLSLLQLSQVDAPLPELLKKHGKAMLERLKDETASFFPLRAGGDSGRTIAYFWSRSLTCPSCHAALSLQKRPWLSKKSDRTIFLARTPDKRLTCYTKGLQWSGEPSAISNAWDGTNIKCPFCGYMVDRDAMDDTMTRYSYDELTCYCSSHGRGKTYHLSDVKSDLIPDEVWLETQIARDLAHLGRQMPESELPTWSGITNPTLYGFHRISDLFNIRQRAVLVRCCRLLREEYDKCVALYGTVVARAIAAFLSAFVDQLVDWNCRICMWIAQNEQVGRAFSGPGIPMMWDFVEIDPVEHGPANLWDKLDRILAALRALPKFDRLPEVTKADARELPFSDEYFDVVITDPPYFDNLYYSVLADCIYVWKRLALLDVFPDAFAQESTNDSRELSASKYRHGSQRGARKFYADGMAAVLTEARRVLKPDGVLGLVFAHSTIDGWASIVEAFRRSHMLIVAAWPMQIERKHRPRGMNSDAVNTSIVLVGRRWRTSPEAVAWADLTAVLTWHLTMEHSHLSALGRASDDIGRSLLGMAASICAQFGEVTENGTALSTLDLLVRAASKVETLVPGFKIARR